MTSYRLAHADDDLALPAYGEEESALRVWLSDRQWMSILQRIESKSRTREPARRRGDHTDDRRDLDDPRRSIGARCMIRVGSQGEEAGIYLVRTRNISSGGIGFVHHHDLKAGSRCTVALQLDDGEGMIVSGRIAWCREVVQLEVEQAAFEIGVQFDRPIALGGFSDHVA